MKLAQFKNVEYGNTAIWDESTEAYLPSGYVRVSDWVEVDFPPLKTGEVIQAQLSALDAAEKDIRAKFQNALNGVKRRRAELLALTYEPEVA